MAQQSVTEGSLSPIDYQDISINGTNDITFKVVYHDDEPKGYELVASGPGGNFIMCARPCTRLTLPTT